MGGYYTLHVITFDNKKLSATNEHVNTDTCFIDPVLVVKPFFIGTIYDAKWYATLAAAHHPWIKEVFALKHSLLDEPERISLLKK